MPRLPLGNAVASLVDWLIRTIPWLFDGISLVTTKLVDGLTFGLTAPPSWVWIAVFVAVAFMVRGLGFALYTVLAFALVLSLQLWTETMQTLAVVLVATLVALIVGVPVGIWAARARSIQAVVRPVLDFMQTTPVFVYLIPAVFFFGVGIVPGVVATTIFAIPPGVRLTELGIRQVDPEVVEAAHAFGARPRQILREVQLPMALPSIMAGVNQVIMLSLSMVVVAGLAGAPGLGAVVVRAVTQLDVATGFEGGLAVVLLAIFLDRLTSALAEPHRRRLQVPRLRRGHPASSLPEAVQAPEQPGRAGSPDAAPGQETKQPLSRHDERPSSESRR